MRLPADATPTPTGRRTVLDAMREGVRTLHPGYFALVMATGIVSVAMFGRVVPVLSTALMWVAAGAYATLVVLYVVRAAVFRTELGRDLADPARGFAVFTFVAATGVLGARLVLAGRPGAAAMLLGVGTVSWVVLGYVIPWAVFRAVARPVVTVANGTWFVWVVASQSVAVLAAAVEPTVTVGRRELALLAVCCWAVGVFLYVAVGGLVGARLLWYDVRPVDITPPYWVAMGAGAITVLAGARISQMAQAPALLPTRGLIAGVSVLFWAFATWLVPLLLAVGWWRHVTHRIPVRYEATWWSMVFPLGMYGVASQALGDSLGLPVVAVVGRAEAWVALGAWLLVGSAMTAHLVRALSRSSR